MMLSKCVICGSKKQNLLKQAKGLLSNLGINKISLLGDILF